VTPDIFEFWSRINLGEKIHPADKTVITRGAHSFDLKCLPSPFGGPLRTAKIVLLFLNPGLSEPDYRDARTAVGKRRCFEKLSGSSLLPTREEHEPAHKWITSITRRFGSYEQVRKSVAVLELCPYHSRNFRDWHMLAALPSSRFMSDWAQNVLFPQAIAGDRIVICMRSPKYWGLDGGRRYGKSLFAPSVTRGGHLLAKSREKVLRIVRKTLDDL
jgi:hypothetical protein